MLLAQPFGMLQAGPIAELVKHELYQYPVPKD
jgi:hypothetical protein